MTGWISFLTTVVESVCLVTVCLHLGIWNDWIRNVSEEEEK